LSHLKPAIHSISAGAPLPSAASIAVFNPRDAWSLDMTPLVRGCSARSAQARKGVGPSTNRKGKCSGRHTLHIDALAEREDGMAFRDGELRRPTNWASVCRFARAFLGGRTWWMLRRRWKSGVWILPSATFSTRSKVTLQVGATSRAVHHSQQLSLAGGTGSPPQPPWLS
jgi:hypothetical protein